MNKRRNRPDLSDLERARADYSEVLRVYGGVKPKDPVKREARRRELNRILTIGEELKRFDSLPADPPVTFSYPVVMRKNVYTDNVRPVKMPKFPKG